MPEGCDQFVAHRVGHNPCDDRDGVRRLLGSAGCRRAPSESISTFSPTNSVASVIRPAMNSTAGSKEFRQLAACLVTQRNQINWLTPCRRFFGAAGGDHLADHSRQHSRRVLPTDEIEALERLVDKVQRVSAVGECSLVLSREKRIREHSRGETARNRREQRALGCLAMAHPCPAAQPAL
jgi:hypothetical protein